MTKVIFLVSINKIIYEQKKGLLTIIRILSKLYFTH